MRRLAVLSTLLVLGTAVAWTQAAPQAPAAGAPTPLDPANFNGKVTPYSTSHIRMNRYHFEPGARTNWHSHEGGQVIYIEEGRLRVQERGGATREFAPGATFHTAPNVLHWHGALPNAGLTQVSLSFGTTNWKERVSDADYTRK